MAGEACLAPTTDGGVRDSRRNAGTRCPFARPRHPENHVPVFPWADAEARPLKSLPLHFSGGRLCGHAGGDRIGRVKGQAA